jgi:hypothetical protein
MKNLGETINHRFKLRWFYVSSFFIIIFFYLLLFICHIHYGRVEGGENVYNFFFLL